MKKIVRMKGILEQVYLPIIEVKVHNMHLHFILDTRSTNSILDERVIIPLVDPISFVGRSKRQGIRVMSYNHYKEYYPSFFVIKHISRPSVSCPYRNLLKPLRRILE